jgi:hypothetical protein
MPDAPDGWPDGLGSHTYTDRAIQGKQANAQKGLGDGGGVRSLVTFVTAVTPLLRLCYAWTIKKPRFYAGCYGVTALDPQTH